MAWCKPKGTPFQSRHSLPKMIWGLLGVWIFLSAIPLGFLVSEITPSGMYSNNDKFINTAVIYANDTGLLSSSMASSGRSSLAAATTAAANTTTVAATTRKNGGRGSRSLSDALEFICPPGLTPGSCSSCVERINLTDAVCFTTSVSNCFPGVFSCCSAGCADFF